VSDGSRRRDVLKGVGTGLVAAGLGSTAVVPATAQAENPTEISTAQELQAVANDLAGDYVLVDDVDLSGVGDFEPLGDQTEAFTGTFDGGGYTITGLTIDRPGAEYVGLFGSLGRGPLGVVQNLTLENVDVTGGARVGGLGGANGGNVANVTVSGSVSGTRRVGGLAGVNGGCVWESESSCSVAGEQEVGGLVGANERFVTDSTATGPVSGTVSVGGLAGSVGSNTGAHVSDSSASGSVTGTGQYTTDLGGLVGRLGGRVEGTTASGDVSGDEFVGTLVGSSVGGVLTSSASGSATASDGPDNQLVGGGDGEVLAASDPRLGGGDRTNWWFQTATGDGLDGGPTVVDGTVYIGNNVQRGGGCEPTLYAVDAASGERQWVLDTDAGGTRTDQDDDWIDSYLGKSATTVVDGTVYAKLRYPGTVVAVDTDAGTEQWRTELETEGGSGSPTLYDGTLYATDTDTLYWLDPATGDVIRRRSQLDISGTSVTAAHGQVYLYDTDRAGEDGLVAVDTETGDVNWAYTDAENPREFSAPTVAQETVFATDRTGALYAVDAADGSHQWTQEFTLDGQTDRPETTPTVADGTVYVGTEFGRLYALDAESGDEQWRYVVEEDGRYPIESAPTVAGDTVFVGSRGDKWNGRLHAVDTGSGDERWTVTVWGEIESAPTVADGTVYAGTTEGILYAVDAGVSGSSGDSRVTLRTLGHVAGSSPPTNVLSTDTDDEDDSDEDTTDDSDDESTTGQDDTESSGTTTEATEADTELDDDESAGSSGPGFGVVGTVGSLVGAGYLARRRSDAEDDAE